MSDMAKKKMEERDWSLLPSNVVQAVADKATSLADYIRFRAVCRPWRSALSPQPLHLPPQLPWLMPLCYTDPNDDSARPFYDPSASKIHMLHLPVPKIRRENICGSSHGWLVLFKDRDLSLLNPITRATIPLPLVTVTPSTIPTGAPPAHYRVQPTDKFFVRKAMLTSSPLDPSCLVFVIAHGPWDLAFCKIGDERWTVIDFQNNLPYPDFQKDFTYSNGHLYTITYGGVVTVYDLRKPSQILLNQKIGGNSSYIIDGVSGDIFVLSWSSVVVYLIYKILINDEEPYGIRVWDIGRIVTSFLTHYDRTVFFSISSSTNIQLPECGANLLFFHLSTPTNHSITLFRPHDGTVTDIPGNLNSLKHIHWVDSIWLTPSLL